MQGFKPVLSATSLEASNYNSKEERFTIEPHDNQQMLDNRMSPLICMGNVKPQGFTDN